MRVIGMLLPILWLTACGGPTVDEQIVAYTKCTSAGMMVTHFTNTWTGATIIECVPPKAAEIAHD
jgi:hypothetical protein